MMPSHSALRGPFTFSYCWSSAFQPWTTQYSQKTLLLHCPHFHGHCFTAFQEHVKQHAFQNGPCRTPLVTSLHWENWPFTLILSSNSLISCLFMQQLFIPYPFRFRKFRKFCGITLLDDFGNPYRLYETALFHPHEWNMQFLKCE